MDGRRHTIIMLEKYIRDINHSCTHYLPDQYLKERAYSIFAAKEILNLLNKYPHISQADLVYNFYLKMDEYEKSSDNREHNMLFQIAGDFAENLLYEIV